MSHSILLLSTMYPNPQRPGTKVCHYFAQEWVKSGNKVIVFHFRSVFPQIYTILANAFPKFTRRHLGAYTTYMSDSSIFTYHQDDVLVYSLPIFKLIPHGKYSRRQIKKVTIQIREILDKNNYMPDVITGHFINPQLEIISNLKHSYPKAKTALVHHSDNPLLIQKLYPKEYNDFIRSFDIMGFRSLPIKHAYENIYGISQKSFLCPSGISKEYALKIKDKVFGDGPLHKFLYVGQFIARKYPKEVMIALNSIYKSTSFQLTYVGEKSVLYEDLYRYAQNNELLNNVKFTGQIKRDDIINYYDEAECFIMISRTETFGLVYLEAMARGCIVIASRNEGMEGIIKSGINGFLCNAGDTEELQKIIVHINNLSKEQKQDISKNAVITAHSMTDKIVAHNYLQYVLNA